MMILCWSNNDPFQNDTDEAFFTPCWNNNLHFLLATVPWQLVMRFCFSNQFCPQFPFSSFASLHPVVTHCKSSVTQDHTGWFSPFLLTVSLHAGLLFWGVCECWMPQFVTPAPSSQFQKRPKSLYFFSYWIPDFILATEKKEIIWTKSELFPFTEN